MKNLKRQKGVGLFAVLAVLALFGVITTYFVASASDSKTNILDGKSETHASAMVDVVQSLRTGVLNAALKGIPLIQLTFMTEPYMYYDSSILNPDVGNLQIEQIFNPQAGLDYGFATWDKAEVVFSDGTKKMALYTQNAFQYRTFNDLRPPPVFDPMNPEPPVIEPFDDYINDVNACNAYNKMLNNDITIIDTSLSESDLMNLNHSLQVSSYGPLHSSLLNKKSFCTSRAITPGAFWVFVIFD